MSISDCGRPLEAWYVAFVDAQPTPWHRLMKPGFRHCYAFAWDSAADRWVVLEPGFDGVYLRPVRDEVIGLLWARLAADGSRVLLARSEGHRMLRPRLLLTCVTAVAALLALRRCCAVSPWQLYRTLRRRGAIEVL